MVTITTVGMEYQARFTNGSTAGAWKWFALGTGSAVESAASTTLDAEITTGGGERALADLSYEASYKSVWHYIWTFSAPFGIWECGIFDQLSVGGHMLMRHKFPAIKNVAALETLEVTMKLIQAV